MQAPVELRGYAALDDQVLALLHRRHQEGRSERAGVVVNVIAWQGVTDTKIYRVPANFAHLASSGQRCRPIVAAKSRVFDNHCRSREFARGTHAGLSEYEGTTTLRRASGVRPVPGRAATGPGAAPDPPVSRGRRSAPGPRHHAVTT